MRAWIYAALLGGLFFTSGVDAGEVCTDGWRITGYYLPDEADFTGPTSPIIVAGKKREANTAFLEDTQVQGWGKTKAGDYIGWWDNAWHPGKSGYGDKDDELTTDPKQNSIATDRSVIKYNARVRIPTLPHGYGDRAYRAVDIGPAIVGKHIDVYTGAGAEARQVALSITGEDNTVCVK